MPFRSSRGTRSYRRELTKSSESYPHDSTKSPFLIGRLPAAWHHMRPLRCEVDDLDAALTRFAAEDPIAARVVELRHFAGLSIEDAATALGLSRATAYRHWTYARAWLRDAVSAGDSD